MKLAVWIDMATTSLLWAGLRFFGASYYSVQLRLLTKGLNDSTCGLLPSFSPTVGITCNTTRRYNPRCIRNPTVSQYLKTTLRCSVWAAAGDSAGMPVSPRDDVCTSPAFPDCWESMPDIDNSFLHCSYNTRHSVKLLINCYVRQTDHGVQSWTEVSRVSAISAWYGPF